jgi:hypothetical protein
MLTFKEETGQTAPNFCLLSSFYRPEIPEMRGRNGSGRNGRKLK